MTYLISLSSSRSFSLSWYSGLEANSQSIFGRHDSLMVSVSWDLVLRLAPVTTAIPGFRAAAENSLKSCSKTDQNKVRYFGHQSPVWFNRMVGIYILFNSLELELELICIANCFQIKISGTAQIVNKKNIYFGAIRGREEEIYDLKVAKCQNETWERKQ